MTKKDLEENPLDLKIVATIYVVFFINFSHQTFFEMAFLTKQKAEAWVELAIKNSKKDGTYYDHSNFDIREVDVNA